MKGRWQNTSGRIEIRYASRGATCRTCPLKARCLSPKASRRTIARWEHEDVLERHRARMQGAGELMRRRSSIVEHPFGTLKRRAGYRHFLVRGFSKVRGEWSLMALCYNFTRVLNILGFERFVAYMAAKALALCEHAPAVALHAVQLVLAAFWALIRSTARNQPARLRSSQLNNRSCPVSSGNEFYQLAPSHPPRGADGHRHERGMGCGGRGSVGAQVVAGRCCRERVTRAGRTALVAYGKPVWSWHPLLVPSSPRRVGPTGLGQP